MGGPLPKRAGQVTCAHRASGLPNSPLFGHWLCFLESVFQSTVPLETTVYTSWWSTAFSSEVQCLCSCFWPFLSGARRQWAGPNSGIRARFLNVLSLLAHPAHLSPMDFWVLPPPNHTGPVASVSVTHEISLLVLRPLLDLIHWLLFLEILP